MIKNIKQFEQAIIDAKQNKTAYRESIQDAICFFVREYNGQLTFNSSYLKEILLTVGNDARDLNEWLHKYTNLTKVKSDLLHFETSDANEITTEKGENIIVYTLKFNDNFKDQKWWETEKPERVIKALDEESLEKLLISVYNRAKKTGTETYTDRQNNILNLIKDAYRDKIKD